MCQAEETVVWNEKGSVRMEDDNARRLVNDGFQRGRAASTISCHTKPHVRVVRGDDFTFTATDSELRKMRARMCEWHDAKVRDILVSGKRDVRETEILGRSLRWTEEGLENEASDKHRQALLDGLGLSAESKTANSAAVKPEHVGQEHVDRYTCHTSHFNTYSHCAACSHCTVTFISRDTRGSRQGL